MSTCLLGQQFRRRAVLVSLGLAALVPLIPQPANAQNYPERPIRIVNTFPAGGSGDQVIRTVFNRVAENIGQNYIVDTRAGASGAIGTTHVARSAPDGYTLVLGTASTFGTNSATQKSLAYDPVADFTPVINMANTHSLFSSAKQLCWPM